MKFQQSILAELLKTRGATVSWMTFVAFALGPIMGGFFMYLLSEPGNENLGMLSAKANAMAFSSTWPSYLRMLSQVIGVGGVLVFGFVASWIFGREYSDNTNKDLLALPVSRTTILNAKFVVYGIWCFMLSLSNLLIGFVIGVLLQLPSTDFNSIWIEFIRYSVTVVLTMLLGSPVAFAAIWGRGYLAPLSIIALTVVVAQIVAAVGWGAYFPWSVPGLYSGIAELPLGFFSEVGFLLVGLTFVVGYATTVVWWNRSDQGN